MLTPLIFEHTKLINNLAHYFSSITVNCNRNSCCWTALVETVLKETAEANHRWFGRVRFPNLFHMSIVWYGYFGIGPANVETSSKHFICHQTSFQFYISLPRDMQNAAQRCCNCISVQFSWDWKTDHLPIPFSDNTHIPVKRPFPRCFRKCNTLLFCWCGSSNQGLF